MNPDPNPDPNPYPNPNPNLNHELLSQDEQGDLGDSLRRLLYVLAWRNPNMGYIFGLNRLGGMLLSTFQGEENVVYWVMVTVLEGIVPTYYLSDMKGPMVSEP